MWERRRGNDEEKTAIWFIALSCLPTKLKFDVKLHH